ncbi:MAG: endonuclease/exonuclease/phosphatase family protein [Bacteroidales bacterium]|nr:endonuclease/exonuclease/phosphatase family protein [Bacteroidales bacterium]
MKYRKAKARINFVRFFFRIFTTLIFFVLCITLLLSLSAKFISSDISYIPSLLSLAFPFILLLFLLTTILLLWRKKFVLFFISLPLLVWATVVFDRYVHFSSLLKPHNCPKTDTTYKIMSFNVRLFDLYNWKGYHSKHQAMIDFILQEQPDIACFQEYYYQSDGKYPTTELIRKGYSSFYIHDHYSVINKHKDHFGIATISKYPIINKGIIPFEGTSNLCIYSDIMLHGDTVRVINMHLESVRFGIEDYAFISSIDKSLPDSSEIVKTKNVLNRLIKALKKRNKQAEIIAQEIKKCPYPLIVCGDFNDVPSSYTYSVIGKGLIDTYCDMSFSLGSTYNGHLPWLRIDYILHSKHFKTCHYTTHHVDLSDHFPISAIIAKVNNNAMHK